MRQVRETLERAQNQGLTVRVGPGCPDWLRHTAEHAGFVSGGPADGPVLYLVDLDALHAGELVPGSWVLAVAPTGVIDHAPELVAQQLTALSLQVSELILLPSGDKVADFLDQPPQLMLAVVENDLAVQDTPTLERGSADEMVPNQVLALVNSTRIAKHSQVVRLGQAMALNDKNLAQARQQQIAHNRQQDQAQAKNRELNRQIAELGARNQRLEQSTAYRLGSRITGNRLARWVKARRVRKESR